MLYQFMMIDKTKIRTYDNTLYTNFSALKEPKDGIECGSFTIITINSLHSYEKKCYLLVYIYIYIYIYI